MSEKNFFCILPWVHMQTDPEGEVFPCCFSDREQSFGSVKKDSPDQIWNNEKFKELRLQFLNGEIPKICTNCHDKDKKKSVSYRKQALNLFADKMSRVDQTGVDGVLAVENLNYIEVRSSNTCNFKCRTCQGELSSGWHREAIELGLGKNYKFYDYPTAKKNLEQVLKPVLPQINHIRFSGGESLVQREHYELLNELVQKNRTDLELSYNTNLSLLKFQAHDIVDLWKRFARVTVIASIDAWGAPGEVLRKGFSTEQFEKNFQDLKNAGENIKLKIHITVSAVNAFHLTKLFDELLTRNFIGRDSGVEFDVGLVVEPHYYDINIMNADEKSRLKRHYDEYLQALKISPYKNSYEGIKKELDSVLSYLTDVTLTKERQEFKAVSFAVDKIRNEKLVQHFPEIFSMLYEK